jgi:hypothetical protein
MEVVQELVYQSLTQQLHGVMLTKTVGAIDPRACMQIRLFLICCPTC